MAETIPTNEQSQNLAPWKHLAIVSASFGLAFALTLSVIVAAFSWYSTRPERPKPWKTDAIQARFASLEFTGEPENFVVEFGYDLENKTDANYRIGDGSGLEVMARLAQGNVLSGDFGHYQATRATVSGPSFIPPKGVGRLTVRVAYYYPSDFTSDDKSDIQKIGKSVSRRIKEMSGFVVFDPSSHYQIELASGWRDYKSN